MEDKRETAPGEAVDKKIQEYLKKFNKEFNPIEFETEDVISRIAPIAEEVLNFLKEKELTYVDAYVTLEHVYRSLKFMSEYTHL